MAFNVNYNDKKEQIAIQQYLHLRNMSEASGFTSICYLPG